jgi:hypothetical protein
MACEEADMYYRWQLLEQIAKGTLPEGITEDDLRAMDMPLPGEIELIEKPDGSQVIRKVDAKVDAKAAAKAAAKKLARKTRKKADAFVCDTPEEA